MKILLFAAGGDIGGGKTHILSLAKELSSECRLRLVCFQEGVMAKEGKALGLDVVTVDKEKGYLFSIKEAIRQYDEFQPDIIHCHGAKANAMGIIVKKKRKIPVITTVHSDPKLDYMGSFKRRYTFGVINNWALKHMDYYVAVAQSLKEILVERGFNKEKIFTVCNAMDFSKAPKEPKALKDIQEPVVVGIAARLNPVKDIKTLLKAFAIAYAKDRRLRLSIAGTGEEGEKLKQLAKELKIDKVTSFEGWISDIKAYFEKIDINVLCSLSEGFPYSLLEGAYKHCPAICSNVGGISSLIIDGKTGLLFQPKDEKTLAAHILKLSENPRLRQNLAENLFQKAISDFSLERMKKDQQAIYQALIKKHPKNCIICGAYGKGNEGDEAILTSILKELRSINNDMPIWVMSRNPRQTEEKYEVNSLYIFNVIKYCKLLRNSCLFVNGGGSLMQDITSSRSLYFYLFTLWAAKKRKCKVLMYGCGIGPLKRSFNRKIASKVLNKTADIITLRDSGSEKLLKEIGVDKPITLLSADPVINMLPASKEEVDAAFFNEGINESLPMIGFCLREWKSFTNLDAIAKSAEYAYKKFGLIPVFYPIESPKDIAIGEKISNMLSIPSYCCSKAHTPSVTIGMLGRMKVICAMRLHALIFAVAGNTPVIGLSYDLKVENFLKDIGREKVCLNIENFTNAALNWCIDDCMLSKESATKVQNELKELEKNNIKAAKNLLEGTPL